MLPWLAILDKEMLTYHNVLQQNKQEYLPVACAQTFESMQEKVAAIKRDAIDGQDIANEASILTEQARNQTRFANTMVKANLKFKCTRTS